jgi:uncharacterized OB-fold protein
MSADRDELRPPAVDAYWEAVDEGRLVVPVCPDCGTSFFPPRVACPYCLGTDIGLRETGGTGEIYSYSTVRVDSHPARGTDAPYPVCLVTLDDGPTLFSTVLDCPVDELAVGMRVTVDFDDLGGDRQYPVFVPTE